MTTLIQDIQAVLDPLLAGGSWYAVNTQENGAATVFPFAVFIETASSTNNTLSGPSDLQNTRVQVDLFSDTVSGLETAAQAVEAAMRAAPFTNLKLSSQDYYESEVRFFRRSFTFSIWSTN